MVLEQLSSLLLFGVKYPWIQVEQFGYNFKVFLQIRHSYPFEQVRHLDRQAVLSFKS